MLSNIKILLEFHSTNDPMHLTLTDRNGILVDIKNIATEQHLINTNVNFPNTLTFNLSNHSNNKYIKIKQLWIGGLEIPKHILEQICVFRPENQPEMVITDWYNNGQVVIELFTTDFIQYHLMYGNKLNQYLDSV